jgi:hypothetical protein
VAYVGTKSGPLAIELAMPERARIGIDQNGLSRCVMGQLVYEPDIAQSTFPFPKRLAQGGLRSMVLAPLQVESRVFGVLVAELQQRGMRIPSTVERACGAGRPPGATLQRLAASL